MRDRRQPILVRVLYGCATDLLMRHCDRMAMRYEKDMTKPVLAWMRDQGLHVRTECATPWGICDLVGVSFRVRNVKRRLALKQRGTIGSEFDVAVLATLPDSETSDGINISEIQEILGGIATASKIESTLQKLQHRRFVGCRNARFAKINGWMPLHQRIVAVELKLSRIEEVIQQAMNHTGFATESYIGLPMEVAHRVVRSSRIERLGGAGVGVLGVDVGGVKTLRRSRPNFDATIPWLQMHIVERFWRSGHKQFSMSGSAIDSGRRVAPSSDNSSAICLP
jgi:hypothetical protein